MGARHLYNEASSCTSGRLEEHHHDLGKSERSWRSGGSSYCELCKRRASVYCPSDEALLCELCDAKVHSANFLVARHSRHVLCTCCGSPTLLSYTGPRIEPHHLQRCSKCIVRIQQHACKDESLSTWASCCVDAEPEVSSSNLLCDSASASGYSCAIANVKGPDQPNFSSSCPSLLLQEGAGDSEDHNYGLRPSAFHGFKPHNNCTSKLFQKHLKSR
eukprot:c38128_g1_i1 orf=164-814(+)